MVFVENNEYSMMYDLYLINEQYEESIHMLKTEGLLSEAVSLQEAAGDKIKEFVDRIITAIAGAWGKFTEAIKKLTINNEEFLKNNKDIILNKEFVDTTINNFYKYDIDKIKNINIPDYDPNIEQFSDNKDQFIGKYFADFKSDEKDNTNFTDTVKNVLRGGEAISIKTTDNALDIKKMYDYCLNFKQIQDIISKDIDRIKESNKKAYVKIQAIKSFSKTEKPDIKKESFDFSKTLDYYFNEADEENKSTGNGPDIQDEEPKNDNNSNNNNTENKDDGSENKETSNVSKAENAIKLYYNICSQYLGARMTIANEAYKAYMKIMKWHVSKHGNKESEAEGAKNADEKNKEFDQKENN